MASYISNFLAVGRDRDRDRKRETERKTETDRQTKRERERERQRESKRKTEGERQKERGLLTSLSLWLMRQAREGRICFTVSVEGGGFLLRHRLEMAQVTLRKCSS